MLLPGPCLVDRCRPFLGLADFWAELIKRLWHTGDVIPPLVFCPRFLSFGPTSLADLAAIQALLDAHLIKTGEKLEAYFSGAAAFSWLADLLVSALPCQADCSSSQLLPVQGFSNCSIALPL